MSYCFSYLCFRVFFKNFLLLFCFISVKKKKPDKQTVKWLSVWLLSQSLAEHKGKSIVVWRGVCMCTCMCVRVCIELSSFLFSLRRHEISGYCLSALAKCKLSEGHSKGYWLSSPHRPLLSLAHLGLTIHFCPSPTVLCVFFKAALWLCTATTSLPFTTPCFSVTLFL